MKRAIFFLAATALLAPAVPAYAQFGGLGKVVDRANQAKQAKDKFDQWNINDRQEQQIGQDVSTKLCVRFGVYQDKDVTKYVSLVGTVLAKASSRPDLPWKFIVLDTEGINAFAAPGGIIHVTKGLLGLMKTEAQLADVIGHEITHVTAKHTINAIKDQKMIQMGSDQFNNGSLTNEALARLTDKVGEIVLNGTYSQANENEADAGGVKLASKVGYNPNGLVEVLQKIDARNGGADARSGLFASHPATRERIDKVQRQIAAERLDGKAVVAARYQQAITFDALPASAVAANVGGASGLASGDKKKDDGKDGQDQGQQDQPKKKGLGLGSITSGSKQANSGQQVSSAGARGIGNPDRDAKGGPNKSPLNVSITPAELVAFKRGIVAS